MTNTTIHDQEYLYYPWADLGEDIFQLARKIIESKREFDRIVALAKGGLTLSRSLGDFLDTDNISSIQIEFYTGIGTTAKTPIITQSLPVSIRDEKVLIFDDIVDKGETMMLAKQYLSYHGAKEITTASLIQKPWTSDKPDFFARETTAWVIFPNETRETITLLKEMWIEKGDSQEQITEQLIQIGFSQAEVEMFA